LKKILEQLRATDSRNSKIDILTSNKDNQDVKRAFHFAYDKTITFGIKKIPPYSTAFQMFTLSQALDMLESEFMTRKVTGNKAIEQLKIILQNLTKDDAHVIECIIKNDMDCGVNKGIIDEIWPGMLSEIPQMLANPQNDANLAHIKFPAYADLKADGARCFMTNRDGEISLNSRNVSDYMGLTDLKKILTHPRLTNYVLDGELIYVKKSSGLASMMGEDEEELDVEAEIAKRQVGNGIVNKSLNNTISDAEQADIVYQVWDIVPVDVYYGKAPSVIGYKERRELLESILSEINSPSLELIETTIVNNLAEAKEVYRKYVERGLEGIILKNMNSVWENARSKNLVKFKEEILVDLKIVDSNPHDKDPNKLGSFVVESACGRIRCNVGSGLKDKSHQKVKGRKVYIPLTERHELDRELCQSTIEDLLGTIIEVKCNGLVTRKNRKSGEAEFKLFLPRVVRRRHDKSVANKVEDVFDVK
jgi:ATP-dependent DNA ligase